jgi:hypothetical protein
LTDTADMEPNTPVASSLKLIDATTTVGGVEIFAGALSANRAGVPVTYTGLKIEGGSGQDYIENDAKNGIVTDGNHNGDFIVLGGAGASAALGTGANDGVFVGISYLGNLGIGEAPGTALGDTVKFGAAATAELILGIGAEAGSTAGTASIGQTNVVGAKAGMMIKGLPTLQPLTPPVNENAAVATATSLTTAENAAVAALGQAGVVYFNYHHDEYIIGVYAGNETSVGSNDIVVHLIGVNNLVPTEIGNGVIRTLTDPTLLHASP